MLSRVNTPVTACCSDRVLEICPLQPPILTDSSAPTEKGYYYYYFQLNLSFQEYSKMGNFLPQKKYH